MNANEIEGGLKNGAGKVKAKVGQVLDDPNIEADGAAIQIEGRVQDIIGQVQDRVLDAADKVTAAATKLGDQARESYGQAAVRAKQVADEIDPFVKQKPYVALGLAAAGGLLFGLLFAGRGPKVVYVGPQI